MAQGQDIRVFNGVMDQDSAPFTIDAANVRYRLNLVNIYNQTGFASNESVRGFDKVTNTYLNAGVNKCIGAFEDVRHNSIVYFVWAENGSHGIYRWYQNKGGLNGVIEKIYQGSALNFDQYKRITHCSLVDNLLLFTETNNEPWSLNIEKINITGKQKIFNLYFDQVAFPNTTTYTLNLYAVNNYTFNWTSSSLTYAGRVNDFIAAVNNDLVLSQYITVENKVNYAQIKLSDVGDYMVEVTPNAFVVADNFYPDATPTPYSYAAFNKQLITAVKYPPFCQPTAEYGNRKTSQGLRVQFGTTSIGQNFSDRYYGFIGINNNSTSGFFDTAGLSVLGPSNIVNLPFFDPYTYNPPQSYIVNTNPTPIQVAITLDLNVANSDGFGGVYLAFARFNSGVAIPTDKILLNFVNNSFFITQSFSFIITLNQNERWGLFVEDLNAIIEFNAILSAEVLAVGANTDITANAYQFRAKYIYDDNEQSVYGAISNIPLPISRYQDIININYADPRLESVELASVIKEVVLALTFDNGTTWYDFKRLQPFEFIGQGRQVYQFNGRESLITVPEAEAILPYHNIPLIAQSQEYIDDRIFYGGLTTGYDKITPQIQISVDYQDTALIPNVIDSLPPYSASYWRRGGEYVIGIEYLDDADRKSAVIIDPTNSRVKIPFYTENTAIGVNNFPAIVQMIISHEPPEWATKYQLVRTKDLSQTTYLQWTSNGIAYENIDGGTAPMASAAYLVINIENITWYQDKTNIGSKVAFPYVNGDRVRFISKRNGTQYNFNDHEIIKVDGQRIYIVNDGSILTSDTTGDTGGDWIEFYSPNVGANDTVFYEFGECFPILEGDFFGIKRKYHVGNISTQTYAEFGFIGNPAVIRPLKGDVFYRTRNIPYQAFTPAPAGYTDYFMSSNTPSEYIADAFYNNGRLNSTELLGRTVQPSAMLFTDRYISGTLINGLNAVQPANTRQYSTIYGSLIKLQVVNNDILKLIFTNGYQLSVYVNQGVIRQSGGATNLISIYDDVAGNSHIIQRTLGTQNPESVVLNDEGDVFGWDELEGTVWLGASNATVQVSDYNMKNTFSNYGLARRKLDLSKSNDPAIYDLFTDLMVITLSPLTPRELILPKATVKLPNLADTSYSVDVSIYPYGFNTSFATAPSTSWYDIVRAALPQAFVMSQYPDGSFDVSGFDYSNFQDSVLVLSATQGGVTTTRSFTFTGGQEASNEPAFSGVTLAYSRKLKGWTSYFSFLPEMYGRLRNQVASFQNGELWLHDKTAATNNFYGVTYPSKLRFVLNKDYPKVKVPLSVWYRGKGNWGAIVKYTPDNMETEMIPSSFRLQENGYAASVTRDRNDPRFNDIQQAWVNGQEIRGDAVEIELYNNDLTQASIDSEKTLYLYSELS